MPTYRAGTVVEIKAYPVTDVSLHVFVNDEQIPMSHFDSDYWGYEFVMPEENVTIHLTYDRFYGRDEFGFDELYGYMMYLKHHENDINKICIKTYNLDEKYSFVENRYSSNKTDIENFKDIFNQRLIKIENDATIDTSYRKSYSFYYEDYEFGELYFYDQYYHWNDFSSYQLFRFLDSNYVLPTIEDPDFITYSFIYDGRSGDVKKYGDPAFSIRYYSSDSVEFVPYEGEEIHIDPTFYLDSRYGKINLLTPTIFELNGEYYEIVSNTAYWAYNYCNLGDQITNNKTINTDTLFVEFNRFFKQPFVK